MSIAGVSFGGQGQNMALGFVKLKDWKLRQRPDLKVKAIAGRAMRAFSQIKGAMVFAFPPPPVIELGQATGFDFQLLDRGGLGHEKLMAARNQLLGMAMKDPRLVRVRPNGMEDVPEYHIDVDWEKAGALGISISAIHNTISAAFGSAYVNDFIQAGRVKKVFAQADAPYRMLPKDLEKLYVRNSVGKMVPFSSFAIQQMGSGFSQAGALQRLSVHQHLGRTDAGSQYRRGHGRHGRDSRQSCPRGSALTGPDCLISSGWQRLRGLFCTPFPFSSSSFAWPPCMKAGPFPLSIC